MWLLKLGGSLIASGHLPGWLAWLGERAACARGLLVVPGGGPFADAVRALQPITGASDLTAHRQALLAMQQFGWLLLGQVPRASPWKVGEERPGKGVSIWLPPADYPSHLGFPEDWRTTSDALALDLAVALGACGLACVKSIAPGAGRPAEQCFDPVFLAHVTCMRRTVAWLGPGDTVLASRLLAGETCPEDHGLALPGGGPSAGNPIGRRSRMPP